MFATFRLYGRLPASRVFPPARITSGQAFVAMDRLREGERRFERYKLHCFAVMPNHVHLPVTPHVPAKKWLGALKGFTGHAGVRVLGLRRGPFWRNESYDHLIRDDEEFARVRRYIEWNPVKAGLAALPEEFPWSSRAPGGTPAAGRKARPHGAQRFCAL